MKLTESKLKQLIVEVMSEVRLEPDYSDFASDDQITKIRSLLDSGDPESINMAKTLLDALGASPSYFDDYMRNQEVGDVEKLANKHGVHATSMSPDWDSRKKALADWVREINKFADREQGRGRSPKDTDKEFVGRYDSVADTYKPKGLSESAVPQEAKEKLFARMKRLRQVPTGATIEDAEFWEVKDGDYGFRDNKSGKVTAIKANGKYYYGEI